MPVIPFVAAAQGTKVFNADYYLAIATVTPILLVAVGLMPRFIRDFLVQVSINLDKLNKRPIGQKRASGVMIGAVFVPVASGICITMATLALGLRLQNAPYEWCIGALFFCVLIVDIFAAVITIFESTLPHDPER